jgi:hypothetical protein
MKNLTGTKVIISLTFVTMFVSQFSIPAFAQKKKIKKVDTAFFETHSPVFIHYSVEIPKGWKTDKLDDELRFHPPDSAGIDFEYPPHLRFQEIKDVPKGKDGFRKNSNGVNMYWDQKGAVYKFQIGNKWYGISIVECNYPELGLDPEKLKTAIFSTLKVGSGNGKSMKKKK